MLAGLGWGYGLRAIAADKKLLKLTFQTENPAVCRAGAVMAISLRMYTPFGGMDSPESAVQRIAWSVSPRAVVSNEFTPPHTRRTPASPDLDLLFLLLCNDSSPN